MIPTTITVPVADLREGDEFPGYYTVVADAEREGNLVTVPVRYPDGGTSKRQWADPAITLDVVRKER